MSELGDATEEHLNDIAKLLAGYLQESVPTYRVVTTQLHGGKLLGETNDILEAVKLKAANKVADCACDCALIINQHDGHALDGWEIADLCPEGWRHI